MSTSTSGSRMLPTDRIDYSAIADRPALKLPGGARMAIWVIVNVEEWDPKDTMPRTVLTPPAGGAPVPDIPNWCWHEYGNRVGFWRMLKVFDEFQIPGVLAINGCAIEAFPPIIKAAMERKWEFIGHGFTQRNMQKVENERADIRKSAEVLEKATGQRPRGWLGPGLTQTLDTPDLLAAAGVKYIGDWVYDDEPTVIKTAKGPLVTLPYTIECNDIPVMIIQHHNSDYLLKLVMDQFDRLYAESAKRAKFCTLAIHPYISGQPHRIKYLEQIYDYVNRHEGVLHWNGEQILDWYRGIAKIEAAA